MREICQSGSMSGNRKQDQANRTEGTRRKPSHIPTGRLQSLRLFSTLLTWLLKNSTARPLGKKFFTGYR